MTFLETLEEAKANGFRYAREGDSLYNIDEMIKQLRMCQESAGGFILEEDMIMFRIGQIIRKKADLYEEIPENAEIF